QMFLFSSRRRHTRSKRDWSSDVCSSDLLFKRATNKHIAANGSEISRGNVYFILFQTKRSESVKYKNRILYDKKIRFLLYYSFPLFNLRCNSLITRLGLLILPSTGV